MSGMVALMAPVFDWASFVAGVLLTIPCMSVTSRAWTGWKEYKALYEA